MAYARQDKLEAVDPESVSPQPSGGAEPSVWGDEWCSTYDEFVVAVGREQEVPRVVETLARLAKGGKALELGIGNGRIALPLAARGIEVHGLDNSQAMLESLGRRPGAERIDARLGDISAFGCEEKYRLVYCVYNTLLLLTSVEKQLSCFECAARALAKDGHFAVETDRPNLDGLLGVGFTGNQRTTVLHADTDKMIVRFSRHDPHLQLITSNDLWVGDGTLKSIPQRMKYVYPSELDLMARVAGLRLERRWASWDGGMPSENTWRYISIYTAADG